MADAADFRQRVAEIIVDKDIIEFDMRQGFKRSSGVVSPFYIDNRKLISYPDVHQEVLSYLIALIEEHMPLEKIDVVAGSAVGGVPHAALIAYKLNKPMVFTRLENGMVKPTESRKRMVEGVLKAGANVVLVEDHVTTGFTVLDSIAALREKGANVKLCISITDDGLQEASRRIQTEEVSLFALTGLGDIVKQAAASKRINSLHQKAIERWQAYPWGFKEWIEKNGYNHISINVPMPVVINSMAFNHHPTFGYGL